MNSTLTSSLIGAADVRRAVPSARRTNPISRFFRPLVTRRTWRETTALLVALPLGIVWFTLAVTMLSLSAGLMVTLLGLPLLVATVAFGRVIGTAERTRARALLDLDLPAPPPIPRDGTWWVRSRRVLTDRAGWRGLWFGVADLAVGVATFTVTVTLWAVTFGAVTFPVWQGLVEEHPSGDAYHWGSDYVLHGWGRVGVAAGITVVGVLLLGLAPRIVHAMANADRRLVRRLLSAEGGGESN